MTEIRKLAAIMFTDMVGYSALTQRNEASALALVAEQQGLLRPILAQHDGREVDPLRADPRFAALLKKVGLDK